MHYKINEPVKTQRSNPVLLGFAIAGWVVLGMVLLACYIMQCYGARLW